MMSVRGFLVRRACHVVEAGGVIAYPTEAVYGLGCLPEDFQAVRKILALKRRGAEKKGLIIVAAELEQVIDYVDLEPVRDMSAVLDSWPGPVTWVFPAGRLLPDWLRGADNSVAIRVSAHPLVQALCRRAGPLISTSANRSCQPPARSSAQVRRSFGSCLDYVYPGRITNQDSPSEIRDARDGRVLRARKK